MRRSIRLSQLVALVAVCLCVLVSSVGALDGVGTAPIDPAVLAEFDVEGEATFFVLFREKADLSPAAEIQDWGERGWFVYRRLVETAESSQVRVRELLDTWGAETKSFWIVNAIEVKTEHRPLVLLLAAQPEVAEIVAPPAIQFIETIPGVVSPTPEAIEWNIEHIRAPEVWNTYAVRGEGIVIGSLDSGVDYDHPALANQYRGSMGGGVYDHKYNWYDPDFLCGNPSIEPCDVQSHGTKTTGIAVGDDGGDNQIGVAPGARFMAAIAGTYPSILDTMQWMIVPTDLNGLNPRPDLRPHVINNSWGDAAGGDPYYQAGVQAWLAAGIFPVFAAGNDGPACNTVQSPADYPESYAVGSHDINDNILMNSSRGPSTFGPVKPDMVAPGGPLRSSVPGGSYEVLPGYTSWATPHVTGTVALMLSLNPELIGDVETIRRHLDYSAIDVSDLICGGSPGDNNVWGEGRLDAFVAVSLLLVNGFESGNTDSWSNSVP